MKKLSILFTMSILAFLVGCTTSDEALIEPSVNSSIGQTWTLHKVSGGLAGISITYPFGEVLWTFNEATNELTVVNNIVTAGPEDVYAGHETGVYPYHINIVSGDSVLFIDNMERGIISINNNILNIDDGVAADGMLTEFEQILP